MPATTTLLPGLAVLLIVCLTPSLHAAPAEPGTTACGGKPADVFFLLDSSRSIWGPDFDRQLTFVQNVAEQFDIRPVGGTRVGVLTYGTYAHLEFGLTTHRTKARTLRAIGRIYQLHGSTRTDAALLRMRELMSRDDRTGQAKVAIVLTDGDSDYADQTKQEAALAKKAGIAVLAVGIGRSVSKPELEAIASDPKYVFSAENFQALDTLKQILAIQTCQVTVTVAPDVGSLVDNTIDDTNTNTNNNNNNGNAINNNNNGNTNNNNGNSESAVTPPQKGCGGKPADVVFIMDGSSSIWGPDFDRQLSFVQDLVGAFDISPSTTRIGVMTYGNKPRDEFQLGRYDNEEEVKQAVGKITHLQGLGTNTGLALHHMTRRFFSPASSRDDVVHIGIVITDGRSDDRKHTARQAEHARKAGIHLFAIGVGANTEFRELAAIASQPTSTHVFRVTNYEALSSIKELLAIETCKVTDPPTTPAPTTTPMPTTTPTTTTPPPADQGCGENSPADLVFALPPLAKPDDTKTALNFIKDLVQEFDIQDGSVRLGLVPKECLSVPGFSLRSFPSTGDMLSSFAPAEEETYQIDTSDVLRHMRSNSFLQMPDLEMPELPEMPEMGSLDDMMLGDEPGYAAAHRRPAESKKIGVIFIDSDSPNAERTADEAGLAKEDGIEMFVVAIGKDVSDKEAQRVATSEAHIFHAADYDGLQALKDIMLETMNDLCSGEL